MTAALAAAASSTITGSKLRASSRAARASSWAFDAAVVKSAVSVLKFVSPTILAKATLAARSLQCQSIARTVWSREGSGAARRRPGADRRLDEPAADQPRHPGGAGGAPAGDHRPLLRGVRGAVAARVRGRASLADERDRRAAAGQPQRHHAYGRPAGARWASRARDAERQPPCGPCEVDRARHERAGGR